MRKRAAPSFMRLQFSVGRKITMRLFAVRKALVCARTANSRRVVAHTQQRERVLDSKRRAVGGKTEIGQARPEHNLSQEHARQGSSGVAGSTLESLEEGLAVREDGGRRLELEGSVLADLATA